ncbi:MAG: hypothetical protein JWS12_730 [Candidatus Saccharibacteria bacterium]|nr:hypothetical protein [Candidatus Saccharibacteria bacterium]
MHNAESEPTLSHLDLIIPVWLFTRFLNHSKVEGKRVGEIIRLAVAFRRALEDARDDPNNTPDLLKRMLLNSNEDVRFTSEMAIKMLEFNMLDQELSFDQVQDGQAKTIQIPLTPALLADLEQRVRREGFQDTNSYVFASMMLYEISFGLSDSS